jgi:hypothetical protein
MSFLKNLFGGTKEKLAPATKQIEHKGFVVKATPFSDGGQFQTCGVVSKEIDGALKEHRFIRADRFASREEAEDFALRKGCQLVDEQGDRLFS